MRRTWGGDRSEERGDWATNSIRARAIGWWPSVPPAVNRTLLLEMLEDLAHHIRDETFGVADAAAVLREIAPYCRPWTEGEASDLGEVRHLLRSGALRERRGWRFLRVAQNKSR